VRGAPRRVGVVAGRYIWRADLAQLRETLKRAQSLGAARVTVATSNSLQHVPHDTALEAWDDEVLNENLHAWLAFADQKVLEVVTLARGLDEGWDAIDAEVAEATRVLEQRAAAPGPPPPPAPPRPPPPPAPPLLMTHSTTTAPTTTAPATKAAPTTPATASSRRPLPLILATLAVAALLIVSLSTGEYSILSQDDGWRIFLAVRVPRTIALILSGAAMSMSGLVMQLVTQNRFAEPSTTGTTEWAGLGLLTIMIAWPGAPILVRMTCAIAFAFAGTMVFFALLRRVSLRSSLLVPIMGMMLGAVVSAISMFIALETNTLQSVGIWFQGSFTSVYEGQYEVLWIVTIVVAVVFIMADRLTAVSLGEDIAVSLGVNYHRMVLIATGLVAVATGVVTVVVGSLPFLGLIVPNLVSLSMGDNLRTNLPWVCLSGIALVTVTDLLARTIISPFEMPVSVILGVLGAFVFIALVLRQARKGAVL